MYSHRAFTHPRMCVTLYNSYLKFLSSGFWYKLLNSLFLLNATETWICLGSVEYSLLQTCPPNNLKEARKGFHCTRARSLRQQQQQCFIGSNTKRYIYMASDKLQ